MLQILDIKLFLCFYLLKFKGIDPNASYQVTNEDSNVVAIKKGVELVDGFVITLDKPLSSQLLTYKKTQ